MHFGYAQCKQRGSVLPIIILIVVVLAVAGGYDIYQVRLTKPVDIKVSPVSVSESKNKTYTNDKLDFQFGYSKELTVIEDSEEEFNQRGNGDFRKNFTGYVTYEPGKFVSAVVVLEKQENYDTNPFTVWIFDNPDDLTIEKWYDKYWYYPFIWGDFTYKGKFELAPKMEATVSGQMAKWGIIDYSPGQPKFVYLAKDKRMYLFRIIGEAGNQILTNFKLLK